MSTAARDQALADHAEKVEMGDEDHILIASKIKKAREFKKTKEKRNQVRKKVFNWALLTRMKVETKHKRSSTFTSGIITPLSKYYWHVLFW